MRFKEIEIKSDLTIIGAGIPGICAAIRAARHGLKVALINNRAFLGGNASPQCRVNICGADGSQEYNLYAREGGIMEEMRLENLHRNPQGNAYTWHNVMMDFVLKEENISLFLNTNIDSMEMVDDKNIASVSGSQVATEKRFIFKSPLFLDDTGDGTVGYLAGNDYRYGREAKSEFNEKIAPDVADDKVLLSTVAFHTKDINRKVGYERPDYAKNFPLDEALENREIPDRQADHPRFSSYRMQWFYEVGFEKHQISDTEEIMQDHRELIHSIWAHIKNSDKYDSDTYDLEFVSPIAGKRESRRLMGDYILTENDIVNQTSFEDTIGYGGWSCDLHASEGFFSKDLINRHYILNGVYEIPYRSCYTKDVDNLFVASRCISTTHVAFGTTRVMATLATLGQSVASAAYLCKKYEVKPRDIYTDYMAELHQILLREDQYIIGAINKDKDDLMQTAEVTASTSEQLGLESVDKTLTLGNRCGFILPIKDKQEGVELLIRATEDTTLEYGLYETTKEQNYKPQQLISKHTIELSASEEAHWVKIPLNISPKLGKVFIELEPNEEITLSMSNDRVNGVLFLEKQSLGRKSTLVDVDTHDLLEEIYMVSEWLPCFKVATKEDIYGAYNLNNGYSRNHIMPNIWLSEKTSEAQTIEIKLEAAKDLGEMRLVFDSELNFRYQNLEWWYDFNVFKEVIKDYKVYGLVDSKWVLLQSVEGNYQRVNKLDLKGLKTDQLKVVLEATNGADRFGVYEIRLYEK